MFADSALVFFTAAKLVTRSLVVSVDQCSFLRNGGRSPGKLLDNTVTIEGILASPGSMSVTNCVFIRNSARWWGGAIAVSFSDALYDPDSMTTPTTFTPFTLTNCTFEDNWSLAQGQQLPLCIQLLPVVCVGLLCAVVLPPTHNFAQYPVAVADCTQMSVAAPSPSRHKVNCALWNGPR